MANAKGATRAVSGRSKAKATVTTALMVDARGARPKETKQFSFTTSVDALRLFKGEPGKIKPLLQRYREAVAESQKAGRSVSFRVDVDPDGDATVTPVDAGVTASDGFPLEEITERSPELERALEAARERGRLRAGEVLAGDDMLNADAFAELLGTTRVTVNAKRQSGQVLGLEGAKRGFRFPAWQVDRDGKPYPELPALLEQLRAPWAVYRFLVQPQGALDGMTGCEALAKGKGSDVLAAAEGIARGNFT